MTAYRVIARKGRATLRQDFPYLSEAFMFMRAMHSDGWTVADPKPVDDGFLGGRLPAPVSRLKTKETTSV